MQMKTSQLHSNSQQLSGWTTAQFSINDETIEVQRARLHEWFDLEELRSSIKEAVDGGDTTAVSRLLCSYLSAASDKRIEIYQETSWEEVAIAFAEINALNSPRMNFPLFEFAHKEANDPEVWEYEGRTWFIWVHILAKAYGWTEEYISGLEIETGLALIQEATVEDQLQKEWEWSLTELAYPYDKVTKTSRFVPLTRPDWMRAKTKAIKTTTMKSSMLPMGVIDNISGMGLHGVVEKDADDREST
jgi:hypothetical protein